MGIWEDTPNVVTPSMELRITYHIPHSYVQFSQQTTRHKVIHAYRIHIHTRLLRQVLMGKKKGKRMKDLPCYDVDSTPFLHVLLHNLRYTLLNAHITHSPNGILILPRFHKTQRVGLRPSHRRDLITSTSHSTMKRTAQLARRAKYLTWKSMAC